MRAENELKQITESSGCQFVDCIHWFRDSAGHDGMIRYKLQLYLYICNLLYFSERHSKACVLGID